VHSSQPDHLDVNLPAEEVKSMSDSAQQRAGATATGAAAAAIAYASPIGGAMTRYRWVICALLFFATTINYMDRQVLNFLAPTLQKDIGWNEAQYGWINAAFTFAYAGGLALVGRLFDRLGTRLAFSLSISVWSLAAMMHGFARTWLGFAGARFTLALGESGNFPGSIKTVAEWVPKKERALATGIFDAGSNVGLLITPAAVYLIMKWTGHWQWAFVFTGAIGFLWLICWFLIYRPPEQHPRVSPAELAYIQSDPAEPTTRIPYLKLLPHRQTWAFAVGKFLTDPVWWVVFNFWLAKYLYATYGLTIGQLVVPMIVIYLVADVGSVGGGWLSSTLLKRGWSTNAARKTAMLVCGLCVVPLFIAPHVHHLWFTVALIAIAAASHQGWSANLFTLVSDTFPRRAVGSVVGFGGMFGGIGGFLASISAGYLLQFTKGNYNPILYVAAGMYLFTLLLIHLLVPTLAPAKIDDDASPRGFEPVV
jgi:ACS family hexuronate transporter-like MFS transporter